MKCIPALYKQNDKRAHKFCTSLMFEGCEHVTDTLSFSCDFEGGFPLWDALKSMCEQLCRHTDSSHTLSFSLYTNCLVRLAVHFSFVSQGQAYSFSQRRKGRNQKWHISLLTLCATSLMWAWFIYFCSCSLLYILNSFFCTLQDKQGDVSLPIFTRGKTGATCEIVWKWTTVQGMEIFS